MSEQQTSQDTVGETAADPQVGPVNFETSLKELEQLVNRLEQGELSLEESLRSFERGIELTRACQQALASAEQKVEQLVQRDGEEGLEPFSDDTQ